MEEMKVPTATFVSTPFRVLAQKRREALRVPSAQLIWVPHPMMNLLPPAIEELAESVLPEVMRAVARCAQAQGGAA